MLQRPAGELTARLERPTWWRRGELEIRTDSGSARGPLSRAAYRDHVELRGEISFQLAVQLASLEEE